MDRGELGTYLTGGRVVGLAGARALCLDDLPQAGGGAVADLPGAVEQVVHQGLAQPLERPLLHLNHKQDAL